MQYKIAVRYLQGNVFSYFVPSYKIVDGSFVEFADPKTGQVRKFHASNCEITEVHE